MGARLPVALGAAGLLLLLLAPPTAAAASPPGDYLFQPSPTPFSVKAGSSTTFQVTVAGQPAYDGPAVSVTLSSAPHGTEGSCFPEEVAPTGSCTFTLHAPADLTPGEYTIRLTASNGTTERSANVTMRVLAPLVLAIAFDRSVVVLEQGGNATTRFQLTVQGNPQGPLDLSLSALDLPAGVTATFDPPSATGGGAYNLTLHAALAAPTAATTIVVNASGGGYATQVPLNLTVVPAGGAPAPSPTAGDFPWWAIFLVALATAAAAVAATRIAMAARAPRPGPHLVEDVFLLHRDGRAIFTRAAPGTESSSDPEVMGSMIVAVQDFARESFRKGTDVDQMRYGTRSVLFARGAHTILAVTVEGEPPASLRERMANAVVRVESQFAHLLEKWDGSRQEFGGLDQALEPLWAPPP